MKKIFLIALLLCVSACATEKTYRKTLEDLVTGKESRVIDKLGMPDNEYQNEGKTYLIYRAENSQTAYNNEVLGLKCKTTIIVERGKVQGYNYEGICISRE